MAGKETQSEIDYREAKLVMAGCPGHEDLDKPSSPNWPPQRGVAQVIQVIRDIETEIIFAVNNSHVSFEDFDTMSRNW